MFRKFCNYAAILSLTLVFTGSAVFANYPLPSKNKTFKVAENKKFSFYHTNIAGAESHTYKITVEPDKTSRIIIRTPEGVSVKIKTASGETKTYSENKFFDIKLLAQGEYEIEIDSLSVSQYKMEIFNK